MRSILTICVAFSCIVAASGCSHSGSPPAGRWEGTYDAGGTIIAARVEITAKGDIFLSAPDATDTSADSDEDRATIRQRLADGLSESWGSVQPRAMDFDGKTFRKPDGIAPQMEWDSSSDVMTLIFYLGTQPALRIPLRPIKDFSANPFANG